MGHLYEKIYREGKAVSVTGGKAKNWNSWKSVVSSRELVVGRGEGCGTGEGQDEEVQEWKSDRV